MFILNSRESIIERIHCLWQIFRDPKYSLGISGLGETQVCKFLRPPEVFSTQNFFDSLTDHEYSVH